MKEILRILLIVKGSFLVYHYPKEAPSFALGILRLPLFSFDASDTKPLAHSGVPKACRWI
jgi:hypothetical protein